MSRIVDLYLVYEFIKRLSTPFVETPAYARGIIDKEGAVIRPRKTLDSAEDKNAWTWFDILINNLKRVFKDLPGGQNRLAIIASSLFLLKEPRAKLQYWSGLSEQELHEALAPTFTTKYLAEAKQFDEDAVANAAGHGGIAGIGVGPQGEPGRRMPRKFAGKKVFNVSSDVFEACRFGKRSGAHYSTYVGEDATGQEIREYAIRNRNEAIILYNEMTNAMIYLRYPKAQQ